MAEDTSVMFEIGVMEHPATKSRIEALTKQVLDAQAKISMGVERVGQVAQEAAAAMAPVGAAMKKFTTDATVPPNMRNVFKELEKDAKGSADEIGRMFDESKSKLPNSVKANTALLKEEYAKRGVLQAKASAEAKEKMNEAIEATGEATERMNSMMVKGGRSLIGMTKGFAELGLMSSETTEKLAKGMVVIQGAFDIFDGAADLMESAAGLRKGNKMAKKAAAMMAEAGGAAVAGTVAKAASGTVAKVVGGAVVSGGVAAAGGAAAGGGAAAAGGVVALAPIVGAATAVVGSLAIVGMAAVQLKDAMLGRAQNEKAFAMQSAKMTTGIGVSILGMTGLFQKMDSPATKFAKGIGDFGDKLVEGVGLGQFKDQLNFTGGALKDFAGAAASAAGVTRMTKALAKNKILTAQSEGLASLKENASNESTRNRMGEDIRVARLGKENTGAMDTTVAYELKAQTFALMKMAESQRIVDKAREGDLVNSADAARAAGDVSYYKTNMEQSVLMQNSATSTKAGDDLGAERGISTKIAKELLALETKRQDIKKRGFTDEQEGRDNTDAIAKMIGWQTESYEKQRGLIKDKLAVEIQGQQKIQESLKGQLDITNQKIQRTQDERASAISNFAKLGQIEQQNAIDALAKGRKFGGGSLDRAEKDAILSVGTKEAKRIATQGDEALAYSRGFGSNNFGAGLDKEEAGLKNEKRTIEAQLSSTYDVNVRLTSDASVLVDKVVAQTTKLIASQNVEFDRKLKVGLDLAIQQLTTQSNDQMKLAARR